MLHKKKNRYVHHRDFLLSCKEKDVIQKGLQVRKTPSMASVSEEFKRKWKNILFNASKEMRALMLEESETTIGLVTNEIFKLETAFLITGDFVHCKNLKRSVIYFVRKWISNYISEE